MTTLTVPVALHLFDHAAQLRLEEAAVEPTPAALAQAFQHASAEQGLAVSDDFAWRVVQRAQGASPSPPVCVPWARPATKAAWQAERQQAKAAIQKAQRTQARWTTAFIGGMVALSLLVGALFLAANDVVFDLLAEPWPAKIAYALLAWSSGCLVTAMVGAMVMTSGKRLPGTALETQARARAKQLEPALVSRGQVQGYAQVPGLMPQLTALLDHDVPLLQLDITAAHAARAEHIKATTTGRVAADRAARAWLRSQADILEPAP